MNPEQECPANVWLSKAESVSNIMNGGKVFWAKSKIKNQDYESPANYVLNIAHSCLQSDFHHFNLL